MDKKNIKLLIIASFVFLLIGFGLGIIFERTNWQAKLAQSQKEVDWLKSELEMLYPPLPEQVYSLYGLVAEKGEDFLVMESHIRVSQFPLPGGKEVEVQNIKVNITEATEIFQIDMPEPLSLEEESAEPFKKIVMSFENIEIGEYITVFSEENIKGKTEITANEIQVGF